MDTKLNWRTALVNIDFFIAGIMLLLLVAFTVYGVIMRYVVNSPIAWAEEVQLACMVWIVFSGAGATFRKGGHVSIEMLVDTLPKSIQKIVEVLITATVVVTLGYLMYQSVAYVQFFMNNGRSTSILRIPYWMIYAIAPVSILSMIANYLYTQYIKFTQGAKERAI